MTQHRLLVMDSTWKQRKMRLTGKKKLRFWNLKGDELREFKKEGTEKGRIGK